MILINVCNFIRKRYGNSIMAILKENAHATAAIAKHLNQLVADSYGLLGQLHLAHWNVEGTDFKPLHDLFQGMYEELFVAIDDIAEQVRILGYYSEGGLKTLAAMSNVPEFSSAAPAPDKDFVSAILVANEVVTQSAIVARNACGDGADPETEDLLIGRIRVHKKHDWFLKSYLK